MATLLSLRQAVYARLGEPYGSPVAQLSPSGTDSPLVLSSNDAIDYYLNEGQALFARLAVPNIQTGAYDAAVGEQTFPPALFSTAVGNASQGTLWTVLSLKVNGAFVPRASRSAAKRNVNSGVQTWGMDGGGSVSLSYPLTGTAGTPIPLVAVGYAVPPLLAADSDTPAWCPADLHDAFVFFAAWQVCQKSAAQNETLGELGPQWQARWQERVNEQQARLQSYDPQTWQTYFSVVGK